MLHLIDLNTGQDHRVDLQLNLPLDGDMAWSPDGQLLFFVDGNGGLEVIDAAGTNLHLLAAGLPPISQIAIRASN